MIAALLALAFQCPDGSPPPCRGARGAPSNSVAVLYFDNETRDTSDAYLADGLTEEIISRLSAIERLTVRSRHLVRRYRGNAIGDPASVARTLNVAYLVTGSVRRSGGRVRVNAELIRAAGGAQVWGRPFDQTGGDMLAIQETVAREVATGIVGRLLPAEQGRLTLRTTNNRDAYDHYLRGNYLLASRNPASMLRAVQDYEAALAADPAFVDARARIAYAHALIIDNEADVGIPRDTIVARGVANAERAVRMDSTSSEAWLALAYVREAQYPRTLQGAREAFLRAIALNPRSAEAHHQYADYLARIGDLTGALAENARALTLEPGRAITWIQMMNEEYRAGQLAAALRLSDSAIAADPGGSVVHIWRFLFFDEQGDTASARRSMGILAGNPSFAALADFLGTYLSLPRDDSAAIARFRASTEGPPNPTATGTQTFKWYVAALLMHLGDRDGALRALEAAQPRAALLHWGLTARLFDPIRADPRFQRLRAESGPDQR